MGLEEEAEEHGCGREGEQHAADLEWRQRR
jgi:hypothetical protein